MREEKQQKRGRRSPRSPEKGNFRSRLGIVEQHYLEAIPGLFVLAKTVSHHPPQDMLACILAEDGRAVF